MRICKRWIAVMLVLVMVGNMLTGVVALENDAQSPSAQQPAVIYQESFELGESMVADASYNGTPVQTTAKPVVWNGASPTAESGISASWGTSYGPATLEGVATGAYDGNNCIKITPTAEGSRMVLSVKKDGSKLGLVDDEWYVASVMIRASEAVTYKSYLQVVNRASGSPRTDLVIGTQWTKVNVVFQYDAAVAQDKGGITFTFGLPGASKGGAIYIDDLQVAKKIDATDVRISQETAELEVGKQLTLSAIMAPWNATASEIVWSSSAPGVATVDENGNVTAVSGGTAVITASAKSFKNEDASKIMEDKATATCTVTVLADMIMPQVLIDDSFENFTANDISNTYTDAKGTGIWNGASPSSSLISGVVNIPSVLLEANVAGAADGNYCLKITPKSSGGRANIHYSFSDSVISALKDGQE